MSQLWPRLLLLGAAMTTLGMLAGLLRGATAPVPSLAMGGLAPVPVVAVLALGPAAVTVWAWANLRWSYLAVSTRPPLLLLLPILGACLLTYCLGALVTGHQGALLENVRNAAGLTALSILGLRIHGEPGGIALPIAYLICAFMFGRAPGSQAPHFWAWILADPGSVTAIALASAGLSVGISLIPGLAQHLSKRQLGS